MCKYRQTVQMGQNGTAVLIYRCHKNAPTVCSPTSMACWPIVRPGCWCGEYKPVGEEPNLLMRLYRKVVK